MSQDSLTEKLAKANGNIKKLCEFFAARRDWVYAPEAEASTRDLAEAAAGVGEQLRRLMDACDAEPADPMEPTIDSIGTGTHDNARLLRFTTFLRDLDAWFAAQENAPTEPEAVESIREMAAHVSCMAGLFQAAQIAGQSSLEGTPSQEGGIDTSTDIVDGSDREPPVPIKPGAPKQLVLDDTDDRPLVQEFQGISELTPDCEKLADEYLTAWDIELSYYNRKKFLEDC